MVMQHPDYPIEFKPAIAAYDWDQTYDILGFSYLPQGFDNLMSLCNIPAYETLAVDRFTPYDYLWAINYSDYLYSFLGYFNYCPFNSIARRTAYDIDNLQVIVNNQPIWIDQFNYFNNLFFLTNLNYFITIPKGKVKITWLTNEGMKQGIIGEIYTLNQCLVNFNFAQDTQIDLLTLKENFKNTFCANSLVFSQLINDQWVEFTPQGINHNYLLYTDIQIYFWEVQQALITYFDYVHNNYGYIIVNELDPDLNEKKIIVDAMPLKTYLKRINENIAFSFFDQLNSLSGNLSSYTQSPLEIFYDYFPYYLYQLCFLQRANNDKWSLGVQIEDIGFNIKPNLFLNNASFLSFNAYKSHIAQQEINYIEAYKIRSNFFGNTPRFPASFTEYDYYEVSLSLPKNSYYLWDYPRYDLAVTWLTNNFIAINFTSVESTGAILSPDEYGIQSSAIQDLHSNIFRNVYTKLNFNTHFYKKFSNTFTSEFRPFSKLYAIAHLKKNSLFINNFSYIKQIKNNIYDIQGFLKYDRIYYPDGAISEFIGQLYVKIQGKVNYSIFDIANDLLPDQYLFFENLGAYEYTKEIYRNGGSEIINNYGTDIYYSDNFDNDIQIELWTQEEYENLYNYGIISDSDYLIYLQNLKLQVENNMVDSVRVKEIHSCLGASEFSYINNDPTSPIYMHIARKVDYIAKALGIAFNGDGSIMGIRQSKALENGETIPAGWNFGQFGRNEGNNPSNNAQQGGNSSEERLGIVYDVRSNKFITNPASGEEDIKQGGYILCESIPQMLHIMLDDLDRALGLQTLGAIAITNQNYNDDYNGNDISIKTPYYKYNGLGDAFVEVMHTLADTHKQAFQANIGSLKSQAITIEILGALGVGCLEKTIILDVDDQPVKILYPGFNGQTPSIADLQMWTLTNQSFLNEVIP